MKKNFFDLTPKPLPSVGRGAAGKGMILGTVLLLLAIAGCGAKPTAPAHTNPADPENPDYQSPGVVMTGGPAEGSTVTNNDVSFTWSGTGSAALYSYSLDNPLDWSGWSADTVKSYINLSEGLHTFRVRAADAGGYQGDTVTAARSFTVNQINNTLLLYPPSVSVPVGDTAEFWCELEDMATPVAGVSVNFYTNSYWLLDTARVSADTGYGWKLNGGTPVGPFISQAYSNYFLHLDVGVAGGTPAGVSGTGRIFKIRLAGLSAGSGYFYISSMTVRDTLNNNITVTNNYGSVSYTFTSGKEGGK